MLLVQFGLLTGHLWEIAARLCFCYIDSAILLLSKSEILIIIKKFRSFKSKENIHKKKGGPYHGFGYQSLISDPINQAKGARGKYCEFANFNNDSRLKD